jgi:hypothetical protein
MYLYAQLSDLGGVVAQIGCSRTIQEWSGGWWRGCIVVINGRMEPPCREDVGGRVTLDIVPYPLADTNPAEGLLIRRAGSGCNNDTAASGTILISSHDMKAFACLTRVV